MTHYIIVRRDLPYGIIAAMVGHAAANSASKLSGFEGCRIVVLEVKSERKLNKTALMLESMGFRFSPVYEYSEPYNGQLMSIGVVPCQGDDLECVRSLFKSYQLLKEPA